MFDEGLTNKETNFSKNTAPEQQEAGFSQKEKHEAKKDLTQETTAHMQDIEASTHLQSHKKEAETLKEQIQKEKKADRTSHLENTFMWEHLTTTDFDFEDIDDEYEEMKKKLGYTLPAEVIARRIKQNRLEHSQKNSQKGRSGRPFLPPTQHIDTKEERQQAAAQSVFDDMNTDSLEANPQDIEKSFVEQITQIQYLIQNFDKLDEKRKKDMVEWLQKLFALFKEGLCIEIYEIKVDDKGNIVIKWRKDGKNITLTIKAQDIGKASFEKVKKTLKDWDEKLLKEIQKNLENEKDDKNPTRSSAKTTNKQF